MNTFWMNNFIDWIESIFFDTSQVGELVVASELVGRRTRQVGKPAV